MRHPAGTGLSLAKHLIDLDEEALSAARAELGTTTIKDTVSEALRPTSQRERQVKAALDVLAGAHSACLPGHASAGARSPTSSSPEQLDLAVLHYDADLDLIAAVTGQRCDWVAPAGSVH